MLAHKFPHAAVWALQAGSTSNGVRRYPVSALLANLANPAAHGKATAAHSAVVTLFHEMGHLFHNLLSRTKYGRFHGTAVAGDFVEAPAKMLENWCWEPTVLKRLSSHYETKEPLSDEMIDRIVKRYADLTHNIDRNPTDRAPADSSTTVCSSSISSSTRNSTLRCILTKVPFF